MKRLAPFLLSLSLIMSACNIATNKTPVSDTQSPLIPTLPMGQSLCATPQVQTNVSCNTLSFYFDPGLAASFDCKTIPEANEANAPAWAITPQFSEVTLTRYILPTTALPPHIDVFPMARYTEIETTGVVSNRVMGLQSLLTGGVPTGDELPLLPVFNAAQIFHSNYAVIPFINGSGIRYLTMYGQDYGPVSNYAILYTFQGLSKDGKTWVSVILPVSNPILPNDASTLPGGETWDQFMANFPTYITDVTNKLNAQDPASFSPSLATLDALVSSITLLP